MPHSSSTACHCVCRAVRVSSVPALSLAVMCRRKSRFAATLRLCLCISAAVVLLMGVSVAHAEPGAGTPRPAAVSTDRFAAFVTKASRRFAIPPA